MSQNYSSYKVISDTSFLQLPSVKYVTIQSNIIFCKHWDKFVHNTPYAYILKGKALVEAVKPKGWIAEISADWFPSSHLIIEKIWYKTALNKKDCKFQPILLLKRSHRLWFFKWSLTDKYWVTVSLIYCNVSTVKISVKKAKRDLPGFNTISGALYFAVVCSFTLI